MLQNKFRFVSGTYKFIGVLEINTCVTCFQLKVHSLTIRVYLRDLICAGKHGHTRTVV